MQNFSFTPELMEIERRKALAQTLQGGAMQPIQPPQGGRMASAVHPFQVAGKLLQGYGAAQQGNKATELARALRGQQQERRTADTSAWVNALQGTQAQPAGLTEDVAGNVTQRDAIPGVSPAQAMGKALPLMGPEMQQVAFPMYTQAIQKQMEEPARIDLGDRIGLMKNGQIVGFIPKAATPDTVLREGGAQTRHVTPSGSAVLGAQTQRRGQDITATTAGLGREVTIRGQDLSAVTQRRGQDLTDRRERDVELAGRLATAKENAKNQAENLNQLPNVIAAAEQALSVINQMLGTKGKTIAQGEKEVAPHPGFEDYVGATWRPGMRYVEGSNAAGFEALYKQLTGQAFLQAFERLKGGGQITQIEGEKGTQAITRMNKAQNEAEFVKASREFEEVIRAGIERAKQRAGGSAPNASVRQPYTGPERRVPNGVDPALWGIMTPEEKETFRQ